MSSTIERRRVAAGRLGVGLTVFDANYTDKGADPFVPGTEGTVLRVRPVPLGKRAVGFFSDEIDDLIGQMRKWRDAAPRTAPTPAVPAEFHPARHRKNLKQEHLLRCGEGLISNPHNTFRTPTLLGNLSMTSDLSIPAFLRREPTTIEAAVEATTTPPPSDNRPILEQLAATVRDELAAVRRAGCSMLHHAMNAGDALIAALDRISSNRKAWLEKNCSLSVRSALVYVRLARHRPQIETRINSLAGEELSLRGALRLIGSEPDGGPENSHDDATNAEMASREPANAPDAEDAAQIKAGAPVSLATVIQAIKGRRKCPESSTTESNNTEIAGNGASGNGIGVDPAAPAAPARSKAAPTPAKSKKPLLLEAWEATPEDHTIIRDLVLEEYFKKTTGADLCNRMRADRSDLVRHVLDALGVDGMLGAMSPEFGQALRARLPKRKKTLNLTSNSAPTGANTGSRH